MGETWWLRPHYHPQEYAFSILRPLPSIPPLKVPPTPFNTRPWTHKLGKLRITTIVYTPDHVTDTSEIWVWCHKTPKSSNSHPHVLEQMHCHVYLANEYSDHFRVLFFLCCSKQSLGPLFITTTTTHYYPVISAAIITKPTFNFLSIFSTNSVIPINILN